jgi:LL-diaminopimelate aminotransferase
MTGDRIGFAVGNRRLVEGLVKVKSQIDSGPSVYIQKVAAKALETYTGQEPPEYVATINRLYRERRDVLIEGLRSLGFRCRVPKATFYIWLDCGRSSIEFALKLLEVGVVVTPGSGFGKYGETYVRLALTRPKEEIKVACERMADLGLTS